MSMIIVGLWEMLGQSVLLHDLQISQPFYLPLCHIFTCFCGILRSSRSSYKLHFHLTIQWWSCVAKGADIIRWPSLSSSLSSCVCISLWWMSLFISYIGLHITCRCPHHVVMVIVCFVWCSGRQQLLTV